MNKAKHRKNIARRAHSCTLIPGVALGVAAALCASFPALATDTKGAPTAEQILRDNVPVRPLVSPVDKTFKAPAEQPRPALATPGGGTVDIKAFRFAGNNNISSEELLREIPLLAQTTGKAASLANLDSVADAVTAYYRGKGYFVAAAYVLAQEVKDGTVVITVLEGMLEKTLPTGKTSYSTDEVRRYLDQALCGHTEGGCAGTVLDRDKVDRAVGIVSDLPGLADVSSTLKPGSKVGTSDIQVQTTAGPTYSGQVTLDNYGGYSTGSERLTADLRLNNPFGLGDRLSFSLSDTNRDGSISGSADYNLPVGYDGWRVGASLSFNTFRVVFGPFVGTHGDSTTLTGYASYPIIRGAANNLNFRPSYTVKKLVSYPGGVKTSDTLEDSVSVGLDGSLADAFAGGGFTAYGLTLSRSRFRYHDLGSEADQSYDKVSYNILRDQTVAYLDKTSRISVYGSFRGQYTPKHIGGAESFGLGGADSVRGYSDGSGDRGDILSLEARYSTAVPAFGGSDLMLAVFRDLGRAVSYDYMLTNNSLAGTAASAFRGSHGISASLSRREVYTLKATWAVKDDNGVRLPTNGDSAETSGYRFWLQGSMAF